MSACPIRPTDPLALCEYEMALALAYEGPDWIGPLMGWADWKIEKRLIEEEQIQKRGN